jgi:TnpA family transposase
VAQFRDPNRLGFALMLCYLRFQKEKRLYLLPGMAVPSEFASMVAGTMNIRVVSDHWFELLRLALSIKTGTVTASVILRKLAAYPRQNGLALALRELGKVGTDSTAWRFFAAIWRFVLSVSLDVQQFRTIVQ